MVRARQKRNAAFYPRADARETARVGPCHPLTHARVRTYNRVRDPRVGPMSTPQNTAISRLKAEATALEARLKKLRKFISEYGDDPDFAETIVKAYANESAPSAPRENGSQRGKAKQPLADQIATFFIGHENVWATAKQVANALDVTPSSARDCMGRTKPESFEVKEQKNSPEKLFRLKQSVLDAAQKTTEAK